MNNKPVNVPASVRDKLLNRAKSTNRPFTELLQYYSIERFLYRLSISDYSQKFFLKGALMLKACQTLEHRATMDIDLLGKTTNNVQNLENICSEICKQDVPIDDGIVFFSNTIRGKMIQTEAEYEGVRIEFEGNLNKAIVHMQIDVGFGDVIFPKPQRLSYPTILDLPAPQLQGYTIESIIAEKLETMIKRGMTNSRMKDFFDVYTLTKQFSLNSKTLSAAIRGTFQQRGTEIQSSPECFSEAFANNFMANTQWSSFIHKNQLAVAPNQFSEVVDQIRQFIMPILEELV